MTLKNYAEDCRARGIAPPPAQRNAADNLGVRRLLDRALAGGSLRQSFSEVGIPPGSVRKLVLITVNAARDPATNIDASDRVPGLAEVADALLFGAGARATTETQEYLADITRQWRAELKLRAAGDVDVFAPDAEIHVVPVNLRDAAEGERRRTLLQVPTAFSISDAEVSSLIEAGREVLRRSPEFGALRRALGATTAPAPAP